MSNALMGGHPVDLKDSRTGRGTGTSTNAYVGSIIRIPFQYYKTLAIIIEETGGANAINYEITGAILDSDQVTLVTNQVVAASGAEYETLTDAFDFVYVFIKSNVGGSHGDYKVTWCAKR